MEKEWTQQPREEAIDIEEGQMTLNYAYVMLLRVEGGETKIAKKTINKLFLMIKEDLNLKINNNNKKSAGW